MKNTIFSNWNLMRLFRLVLGIIILVQAIEHRDVLSGILALAFMAMPIFNIGCCGTKGCAVPFKKLNTTKNINYEEVV
jgi:hypothetical protein